MARDDTPASATVRDALDRRTVEELKNLLTLLTLLPAATSTAPRTPTRTLSRPDRAPAAPSSPPACRPQASEQALPAGDRNLRPRRFGNRFPQGITRAWPHPPTARLGEGMMWRPDAFQRNG